MIQSGLITILLCLLQFVLALPWLVALDPKTMRPMLREPKTWGYALLAVLVVGVGLAVGLNMIGEASQLMMAGRLYAILFHLQVIVDFFVLFFLLVLWLWPQGGAVAQAAFREAIRQPLFWLIFAFATFLMVASIVVPYFTFGEEVKVVAELGYDTIVLAALFFCVFEASIRISEEIEGRTAITVMSKPVSRRQFLLGKFLGILLAGLFSTLLLGMIFNGVIWLKLLFDGEKIPDPAWLLPLQQSLAGAGEFNTPFITGALLWLDHAWGGSPGLIFGFCQVMVLLALAVALVTRLPMVVTIVTVAVIFALGQLTYVLVAVSAAKYTLVNFLARFFDILLPGLKYFNYGTLVVRDIPPPPGQFLVYVGSVVGYAVLYTLIALLLGLVLFEDRDLA